MSTISSHSLILCFLCYTVLQQLYLTDRNWTYNQIIKSYPLYLWVTVNLGSCIYNTNTITMAHYTLKHSTQRISTANNAHKGGLHCYYVYRRKDIMRAKTDFSSYDDFINSTVRSINSCSYLYSCLIYWSFCL